MKIDRGKLEDVILKILNKLNKSELKSLKDRCMQYNMTPLFTSIIVPVQEFGENELYWILKEMRFLNYTSISCKEYFTDTEIETYDKSVLPSMKKDIFPVIFHNVQTIKDNQWQCVMPIEDLIDLKQRQVIMYNPKTQRPLIVIEKGEKIITKIDLNQKSVREIMNLMRQGLYNPHHITINLNKQHNTEPIFDGNDIIVKDGQLDIIDGYHNYIAATRMKAENLKFQYNMPVIITHFDEKQAGMYIAQENKKNIIDTNYTESLNILNVGNLITARINDDTNFYLFNKIQKQSMSVDCIKFAELSNIIYYYYKYVKQGLEVAKTAKTIISYWNKLLEENVFEENHRYTNTDLAILITCCKYNKSTKICKETLQNYTDKISIPFKQKTESSILKLWEGGE